MTCMALVRLGILFMNDLGMGQQVRLVVIHLQSHARMSSSNPTLLNDKSANGKLLNGLGSVHRQRDLLPLI